MVVYTFSWTPAEPGITRYTLDTSHSGISEHMEVTSDGSMNTVTSGEFIFNEFESVHVELRAYNSSNIPSNPAFLDLGPIVRPATPGNFVANFVRFQ